ncbi:MAG: magnesium chelatase ATPase subunit D [Anaerolineae bacterium]|nr:magnesium chelatase ATPase subunit D [Anaerolineae bacterium]
MKSSTNLPFPALIGLELAQQALFLLAVEPQLRGVVLAAPAGTGKSSLARGMRNLLGDDDIPFIEIPTSIDVENLLGGLDLEATLRTGQMVLQPGVLARANGGLAYVDSINLLTDGSANLILSVIDQGEVRVEREGISLRAPARFSLIGSYDPAEGLPRRHLLDRVGLLVTLPGATEADQRQSVVRHNLFGPDESWSEELDFSRGLVRAAREHLPKVTISDEQMQTLSVTALQYGVEGHRVDLFAVQAACASAALALRESVDDEDLELAARLVILPRATRLPPPPPSDNPPPPPPPPEPEQSEPEPPDEEGEAPPPQQLMPPPEQVLEALANELPDSLEELPFHNVRRGRTGSRGTTAGKRGRHVRSILGDPRRARIDVVATLRTAAPWQQIRKGSQPTANEGRGRVLLQMSDVRIKQYRSKAGALFCFAVDASGSMALHRMRQAKGAIHALLQKAYVHRDRVALIAFRGEEAELLMPPTQSVELARRALDLLPTGGGTPLASALLLALDVAKQAESRGIYQTVLLLLTDGRANIGLRPAGNVQEEIQQLGRHIAETSLQVIVVDTKRNYLSRGEAKQLAEWLKGEYAYLPNANGEQIADLATSVAGD